MKKILLLPFLPLLSIASAFAIPTQPINGGTGISNSNSNTITLGGAILTAGSFTLSGAYSTTLMVTASTVITLPSGTHTLASNDGSNASGTWPISITGSASGGSPPTGIAGGDLTSTYPNPTIASGAVGLASSKVTGILPIANGGSNSSATPASNSVLYFDGTHYNSSSVFQYNGSDSVTLSDSATSVNMNIGNTNLTSGTDATIYLSRGGDNSYAQLFFRDKSMVTLNQWEFGLRPGDSSIHFYDLQNSLDRLIIDQSGNVTIPALTANQLIGTNGSSVLTSSNLSGDVTSSGFATTVSAINGSALGSTTATAGNLLIGSGTQWVTQPISGIITLSSAGSTTLPLTSGQVLAGNSSNIAAAYSCSANDIFLFASTGIGCLSTGSGGQVLHGNSSGAPTWSPVSLVTDVTGVLPNSNTTASSTNIASSIVSRDGSGNFSAGTISAALSGNSTSATNISGGSLGAVPYQTSVNSTSLLSGNITAKKEYLSQTGTGSVSAAPAWSTISASDITSGIFPQSVGGTNTDSSAYSPNQIIFQNSSNTAFNSSSNFTFNGSNLHTIGAGTTNNITNSIALFDSGSSPVTTNLYGIAVGRQSADFLLTGVNSTSAANQIPANAVFLSSYGSGSTITIGRGNGTGLPSEADLEIDGSGNVLVKNGNMNVGSLSAAQLVFTDSSKNLTSTQPSSPQSLGLTGASGYGSNRVIFQNSANTAFTSNSAFTYTGNLLTVGGGGGSSALNSLALFNAGVSTTDANIYAITIDKTGFGTFFFGVNKNTATGNIPAEMPFISTFSQSQQLCMGRGAGSGVPGADACFDTSGNFNEITGNLAVTTAGNGVTIKSAAVSAGTANAAVVTGVTLSGGTVTINDSFVNTNTVCYASLVTAGGTPGTAWGVTVASGSFSVKSTSTLDDSTLNVACLKGN